MNSTEITNFLNAPAYSCVTIEESPSRIVEKDIDDTTYLHVVFPNGKKSIWNMLCKHANQSFPFVSLAEAGEGGGRCCDERSYATEFGESYFLNLSNDYTSGEIAVYCRIPTSNAAIQQFLTWGPNETNCIKDLKKIIHAAAAEVSVNETYQPGTLLGDYCD